MKITAQDLPDIYDVLNDLEDLDNPLVGPWRRLLDAAADHPQADEAQVAVAISIIAGLPNLHLAITEAITAFGRRLFDNPNIDLELEALDLDDPIVGENPPIEALDPLDLLQPPEDPNANH